MKFQTRGFETLFPVLKPTIKDASSIAAQSPEEKLAQLNDLQAEFNQAYNKKVQQINRYQQQKIKKLQEEQTKKC